ncbi:MAG: hypothetical protein KDK91_24790, partial [Gammaproteobacteria bacterium]|nr:hypothetical protein [Gammaproteobacteria bacterium]
MSKRIFYISRGRLAAYPVDGQVRDPLEFNADEEGLRNFSRYLDQFPREPAYILVDFVEEEFREDTVPHVFGRDRQAVVQNKLNRMFRDASYATAMFQERERSGRRDDRLLFTALIRPELLAPWISAIDKYKVPLAGVYSLPLVSGALLKRLKVTASHVVIVSLQSSGGLRQTFFLEGRLKISRLALLGDLRPERAAPVLLSEIERLRRYLNSLRLLPLNGPLDVYFLCSPRLQAELAGRAHDTPNTRHHLLALEEVARRIGMRKDYPDAFAERLFVHLLARTPPQNQYAPKRQTRYFSLYNARRTMYGASVLGLMALLGGSGYNVVNGINAREDGRTEDRQARFYEERYERARSGLPETPADSRDMQRVVEAVDELQRFRQSPFDLLGVLSDAMSGFDRIVIDELEWVNSAEVDALDRNASSNRDRGRRDAAAEQDATQRYQLARVHGHIEPFAGDYREALELVKRFEASLRAGGRIVDVTVESLPLDIGSAARLSGDTEQVANTAGATFALRLALRTAGETPAESTPGATSGVTPEVISEALAGAMAGPFPGAIP